MKGDWAGMCCHLQCVHCLIIRDSLCSGEKTLYSGCSPSDWWLGEFGVGWTSGRLYKDPWGGVAVSSTSEGTHTQTHTHLIRHHDLHLSISGVELQQTVSDAASFVCSCDERLRVHLCSPELLGYLCRSGCGGADQRLLRALCLSFLSVCLHAG